MDENLNVFQTMTTTPRKFPQIELTDTEDRPVNVELLASSHHLILITLKNVTCPICPQLLKILNMYGLDSNINTFSDPFSQQIWEIDAVRKRFFRLLLKCDAYFIILCPGTNAQVGDIQRKTPFLDYPFIAGEQAITVAKALKVHLSDQEIMPAILEVHPTTLSVDPVYIGRGPGNYFHNFLLKRLLEDRCKSEMKGIICLRDIQETINQLKRKIIKCQNGKMAATSLVMSPSPWSTRKPFSARLLATSPTMRSPPPRPTSTDSFEQEQAILISEEEPPLSPLPAMNSNITIRSDTTTTKHKKERSLDELPSEILELIFSSYCDDISSLVKTSRTCRLFYVSICNVLTLNLRYQMICLKPALPQENGKVIWDEAEVANQNLDRWSSNNGDGVPFRELQRRVSKAYELLLNINKWTRHWSPGRLRRDKNIRTLHQN